MLSCKGLPFVFSSVLCVLHTCIVFHCLRLDNTVKEWVRRKKKDCVHACSLAPFFLLLFMIFWRLTDVRTNNTNLILVILFFFFIKFNYGATNIVHLATTLTIVRRVYWRQVENEKQSSCDQQRRWNVCVCVFMCKVSILLDMRALV